jgi:hypothetical protein
MKPRGEFDKLTRFKGLDAIFAPDPALFHATPWRARVVPMMGVHPHQAGLQLRCHLVRTR